MRPYDEHMGRPGVSTTDAARELGIATSTLQWWARTGVITPAWRSPGGRYRWDLGDLRRQLNLPAKTTGEPVIEATTPLQPSIVAAIITSSRGVLAERRHDGRPLWTFPAGEAEPGEAPADTAIRETKEETGLEIKVSHIIGQRQHPKTGRHMIYLAARPYHGTKVFVGDEDELAEVKWLSLAEAVDLMPTMFDAVHAHLEQTLRG